MKQSSGYGRRQLIRRQASPAAKRTFNPEGQTLYVADTSRTEGGDGHTIYAFPVLDGGRLGERHVFAEVEPGVPDGFRVDRRGWIWAGSEAGVQVFSAEGHWL